MIWLSKKLVISNFQMKLAMKTANVYYSLKFALFLDSRCVYLSEAISCVYTHLYVQMFMMQTKFI